MNSIKSAAPLAAPKKNLLKRYSPTFFKSNSLYEWAPEYKMPAVSLRNFLHGEPLPIIDGQFTLLNQNYIHQNLPEIRNQFTAIGTTNWDDRHFRCIDELVTFNYQRQTKQWTGILVATMIKVKDGKHFIKVCNELEKKLLPIISKDATHFESMQKNAARDATEYVQDFYAGRISAFHDDIQKITGALASRKHVNPMIDDSPHLVIQILTNDIYRDQSRAYFKEKIQSALHDAIRTGEYEALPRYQANQRVTQMLIGAPATGKSFLMRQSAEWFEQEHGMPISDFANVSPDRYRLLLIQDDSLGNDHRIYGSLTHAEARYMTGEALQLIENELAKTGAAPNIFIEQMNVYDDEIRYGTLNDAKLRVSITSYSAIDALKGNLQRYRDKNNRLVPADIILRALKDVTCTIPNILMAHQNKNIIFSLYDTHRMIQEKVFHQHALISQFNCHNKTIHIHDVLGLLKFIKKSHINASTEDLQNIYPISKKIEPKALIQDLIEQYRTYEWHFFTEPPESKPYVAYAKYSKDSGLVILDQDQFNEMTAKDVSTAMLFDALDLEKSYQLHSSPSSAHPTRNYHYAT
ncbi:MAG: hypothetical protein SFW66_07035 [Gammaproteobacteria bacterium]|nr:hypothetical protein [Gammaproteobacteria bacterium]